MGVMALERLGQQIRRRLVNAGRHRGRPPPQTLGSRQEVHPQPSPEQVGHGQPAQRGGVGEAPGDPDRWIQEAGLGVANHRPATEP